MNKNKQHEEEQMNQVKKEEVSWDKTEVMKGMMEATKGKEVNKNED